MGGRELTPETLAGLAADGGRADQAPDGTPRVHPATAGGVGRVLREATGRGWRVRVEHDAWSPLDAAADCAVSTRALDAVADLAPVDQVVTVGAGVAAAGIGGGDAWCALDAPGNDRTVGGVLATATGGPLRAGFGPVRDQVLGLIAVTGDGRLLSMGGRVLKNVAGYDLAKLFIGGFDAWGVIVGAHLRLRAFPRHDHTVLITDTREALLEHGLAVLEAGEQPVALELMGSGTAWTLAIRRHDGRRTEGTEAPRSFWREAVAAPAGPVTLRVGTVPDGVARVLELLDATLPPAERVTASLYPGVVRWSGDAGPDRIARARREAAAHAMPLILERAPWPVRSAVGVFGTLRPGVAPVAETLRRAFDPAGVLVV